MLHHMVNITDGDAAKLLLISISRNAQRVNHFPLQQQQHSLENSLFY